MCQGPTGSVPRAYGKRAGAGEEEQEQQSQEQAQQQERQQEQQQQARFSQATVTWLFKGWVRPWVVAVSAEGVGQQNLRFGMLSDRIQAGPEGDREANTQHWDATERLAVSVSGPEGRPRNIKDHLLDAAVGVFVGLISSGPEGRPRMEHSTRGCGSKTGGVC